MSKRKFNLVCVAHPDDETIFFGGLIQRRRQRPWIVICLTDGNADGQGERRRKQFRKACATLGVEQTQWWGYEDRYEKRLPTDEIVARLRSISDVHEVFTHGIMGEYGHPHHQDTSLAVHRAFADRLVVHSVAYNAFPKLKIPLTAEEYAIKTRILTRIYGAETNRFLNLLPATAMEGFVNISNKEILALYDYLALGKPLRTRDLDIHRWMVEYLRNLGEKRTPQRPF